MRQTDYLSPSLLNSSLFLAGFPSCGWTRTMAYCTWALAWLRCSDLSKYAHNQLSLLKMLCHVGLRCYSPPAEHSQSCRERVRNCRNSQNSLCMSFAWFLVCKQIPMDLITEIKVKMREILWYFRHKLNNMLISFPLLSQTLCETSTQICMS